MRFQNILKSIAASLLLMPAFGHAQSLNGKWVHHPSFYQQVDKMIDGESSTYFLLHQQVFDTRYNDYNSNTAGLFRYDKNSPGSGIKALSNIYDNFPVTIRTAVYSPVTRQLTAVADDGTVWVIPDNGEPKLIAAIDIPDTPGEKRFNSMTESLSDGKIWIAATFGYVVMDTEAATVERQVTTNFPIDWLAPVGDDIIFFTDGKAMTAKKDAYPSLYAGLTNLPLDSSYSPSYLVANNNLKEPKSLMPLTATTFAFIGPRNSTSAGGTLAVATKKGDKWAILPVKDDELRMHIDRESITTLTSDNAYPNKDGYFVYSQNDAYQLKRGIDPNMSASDPAADFASRALVSQRKLNDSWMETASWDFKNFWFFKEKEGFYQRAVSSDNWNDPTAKLMPEAPLPYIVTYMTWVPGYGLAVGNHGIDPKFTQSQPNQPWLISIYNEGKWTNKTPAFNMPAEYAANETNTKKFNSSIESFPAANPDGFAYDPNDPKYVFAGSLYGGLVRANIADPSDLPLIIGHGNNTFKNYPGFIEDLPTFSKWTSACRVSAPYFDSDGRLWSVFYDIDQNGENKLVLLYYTKEDLQSIKNAAKNPSSFKSINKLVFDLPESPKQNADLITLTAPSNKNIIALHTGIYGSGIYLLDHNGTPANTADDKLVVIEDIFDSEGGNYIKVGNPSKLWEDPTTGLLYASSNLGTFVINPSEAFAGKNAVQRIRVKDSENASTTDRKILENTQVNAYAIDNAGRMWIGTDARGLLCLSADRKTLLGEFNASNSGLPSDRIFSIASVDDHNSVMVSTAKGLVEFVPDGYAASTEDVASVSPRTITPSFYGNIVITGLPENRTIQVADKNGNICCELGRVSNGQIIWNGTASDGKRLSTGAYDVIDSFTKKVLCSFNVIN